MCIRIKTGGEPTPMKGPPPITPRVEKDTSVLPKGRDTLRPGEDKGGVEFGSSKKQAAGVGTVSKGTDALRIPLNVPGGGTATGSGVNP